MSEPEGGGASRTTDPAAGSSAATDVSLREYLTSLIHATERRSEARFTAMQASVDAAFAASQLAIDKASTATEKRFEGVNEFRAQLADQAVHFVTRQTIDALMEKLEAQILRQREDLDTLAKRIDLREGEREGSRLTIGNLIALATVGIAALGLVIVLTNWATSG